MPQQQAQPERSRWVDDTQGIVDSVTRLLDSLGLGGGKRPDFGPTPSQGCPQGQVLVAGVCQCPEGQEYKNGRCQKKGGSTMLWVGVGIIALAGTYFLITKFKNK